MPRSIDKELKEIFEELKTTMSLHNELGYQFPLLSDRTVEYMEKGLKAANPAVFLSSPEKALEDLREEIGDCTLCKLHIKRRHLVFGEGSAESRLVFVGEGPGRQEDAIGKPFVGEAGELLTRIIKAMGLSRQDVYICNVVKCRPPQNRNPERDEIEACIPFLKRQLEIIRPEVICTLGNVPTQELLGTREGITRLRGKWCEYEGIPLMPTFHPAYIVRNKQRERELKGYVWQDIQMIMKKLGLEVKKNA